MRNRRQRLSRQGTIMPLILGMVLTLSLIGFMAAEVVRARVLEQEAEAIARALAMEILHALQPSASSGDAPARSRLSSHRLDTVAMANGYSPARFHRLRPDDIRFGASWARVTIRARHRGAAAQTVTVNVRPAAGGEPGPKPSVRTGAEKPPERGAASDTPPSANSLPAGCGSRYG